MPDDALLHAVAATARVVFDAAACSIAVLDGAELVFEAADGAGADAVVGMRIPATQGIAGWAVMSGQALAVGDAPSDARFAADAAEATGYVPTAVLAAPLLSDDGDALGVFEVLDPGAERSLDVLGRFADLAARAVAGPPRPVVASRDELSPAEQEFVDAVVRFARNR